jgi:hypothetical protein
MPSVMEFVLVAVLLPSSRYTPNDWKCGHGHFHHMPRSRRDQDSQTTDPRRTVLAAVHYHVTDSPTTIHFQAQEKTIENSIRFDSIVFTATFSGSHLNSFPEKEFQRKDPLTTLNGYRKNDNQSIFRRGLGLGLVFLARFPCLPCLRWFNGHHYGICYS